MQVTSSSEFRKNIKRYIDAVDQDSEPLIIARSDDVSVVVLPLETYNAYVETDYLLRSPANAQRLRESLGEARNGNTTKHRLTDI